MAKIDAENNFFDKGRDIQIVYYSKSHADVR